MTGILSEAKEHNLKSKQVYSNLEELRNLVIGFIFPKQFFFQEVVLRIE